MNAAIVWNDDTQVHLCEKSEVHPGVVLVWTVCQRDVPANQAHYARPGMDAVTCPDCLHEQGNQP